MRDGLLVSEAEPPLTKSHIHYACSCSVTELFMTINEDLMGKENEIMLLLGEKVNSAFCPTAQQEAASELALVYDALFEDLLSILCLLFAWP